MAKKDDLLWKGILEEVFDDFLRFMYEEADAVYDLNKEIAFLDKEIEQLFPLIITQQRLLLCISFSVFRRFRFLVKS